MTTFQTTYPTRTLPVAFQGDYASDNPKFSAIYGQYSPVADRTNGCKAGSFVWPTTDADGTTLASAGSGMPDAFLPRQQQATIVTPRNPVSNDILPGQSGLSPMWACDVWLKFTTTAATTQAVFVSLTDGTNIKAAAAGSTQAGFVEVTWATIITATTTAGDLAVVSLNNQK